MAGVSQPFDSPSAREKDSTVIGNIKHYNPSRGFGFIITDSETDIFFHVSGLAEGYYPASGDQVQFEMGNGKRGPIAIQVQPLDAV